MGSFPWMKCALIALLTLGRLLFSTDAHAQSSAESFVQSEIDQSYALLNDRMLNENDRQQAFCALLFSMVDTKRVALFTLGPYARGASDAGIHEFSAVFANFLAAVYQQALEHHKDQTVRVTGSAVRSADDVIVSAVVGNGNGPASPLHVAFRVRQSDTGANAITDFQVEGAWLALTQRADFMSYLQQHGGSIALLSSELQNRTERVRVALGKPAAPSDDQLADSPHPRF